MSARHAAVRALLAVLTQKRSLAFVLPDLWKKDPSLPHALVQEIVYGTLRHYWTLDFYLGQLLEKPLKSKDEDVRVLLLIGLYQLRYMSAAEHAVVNETVEVAEKLRKTWAKGLINAVLRAFITKQSILEKKAIGNAVTLYSHPTWMVEKLKSDWHEHDKAILKANNARAPMSLRVNARLSSRDDYLQLLTQSGKPATVIDGLSFGIQLNDAVDVNELPHFRDGWVSVQDTAAQFASKLLDVSPGQRVLDACCAPGGKTAAILESEANLGELVALDVDAQRLLRVRETLTRLKLAVTLKCADAANLSAWWDGKYFDRVLLDAPCSGTGVIRRNPDIKHLRTPEDIVTLADRQRILLDTLWEVLAPGGLLVYATCSIVKDENEKQIERFLATHANATILPIVMDWGLSRNGGWQILPGERGADGFFYARLQKQNSTA